MKSSRVRGQNKCVAGLMFAILFAGFCGQAEAVTNSLIADNGIWNTATSWSEGTVPTGAETVLITTGKTVRVTATLLSSYTGDLIIQTNATFKHERDNADAKLGDCMPSGAGRVFLYDGATIQGNRFAGDGNTTTVSNNFVLSGTSTITRTSYGNVTVPFTGIWSGTGGITFGINTYGANDTYKFEGSAPNTYSGGTILQDTDGDGDTEEFYANADGCFGTGDVTVNSYVELRLNGSTTDTIDDTATLNFNAETLNLYNNNETVANLNVYGHAYPTGTYSSVGSSSTVDYNIGWISGDGVLTVTNAPGDSTPPSLTNISDNVGGGPILVGAPVTYTVQFDESIVASNLTTSVFEDGGTTAATIDSVTVGAVPMSCTVVATPTTTGNLILQVKQSAVVKDLFGNALDTTAAIPDDTTISIVAATTQDGIWDTQDGSWGVEANWQSSTVAYGVGSTATFPNNLTANSTVSIDGDITIGNIDFQETGQDLTISGSKTLTLDVSSGSPTIDVNSGRTLTISSTVAGSDGLKKSGLGQLIMASSNTFTGDIVIEGGVLKFSADDHLGAAGNDVFFTNGTSCTLQGGTRYATSGSNRTMTVASGTKAIFRPIHMNANPRWIKIEGPITGDGDVQAYNDYVLGSAEVYFLSTMNDFKGELIVGPQDSTGAPFELFIASLADGPGYGNITFGKGKGQAADKLYFIWDASATNALLLDNRQFELWSTLGSFYIQNNNANAAHTITVNTDLLVTGTGDKTLVLTGGNPGDNTFAGAITNAPGSVISLTKAGGGTWALAGENTYSGMTTMSAGTLRLSGQQCIPDAGTLNITGGTVQLDEREKIAVLQFSGSVQSSGMWGAPGNGKADHTDARFTGTELLFVGIDFPPSGTVIMFR